jgi:hypothetical protein
VINCNIKNLDTLLPCRRLSIERERNAQEKVVLDPTFSQPNPKHMSE